MCVAFKAYNSSLKVARYAHQSAWSILLVTLLQLLVAPLALACNLAVDGNVLSMAHPAPPKPAQL